MLRQKAQSCTFPGERAGGDEETHELRLSSFRGHNAGCSARRSCGGHRPRALKSVRLPTLPHHPARESPPGVPAEKGVARGVGRSGNGLFLTSPPAERRGERQTSRNGPQPRERPGQVQEVIGKRLHPRAARRQPGKSETPRPGAAERPRCGGCTVGQGPQGTDANSATAPGVQGAPAVGQSLPLQPPRKPQFPTSRFPHLHLFPELWGRRY